MCWDRSVLSVIYVVGQLRVGRLRGCAMLSLPAPFLWQRGAPSSTDLSFDALLGDTRGGGAAARAHIRRRGEARGTSALRPRSDVSGGEREAV